MTTLLAFFDMDFLPVSFDAVTQIVRAKFEAQERGCENLHVIILPNSRTGFAREWGKHDAAATQWRFWHIVMASIPLAGPRTTVMVAPSREWADHIYLKGDMGDFMGTPIWMPEGKAHFMGPLVDAARAGKRIPKLRATDAARRYVNSWFDKTEQKQVVTITTRGQSTDPDRNSNAAAHGEMREWLRGKGYEVVHLIDSQVSLSREPDGCFAECDVDLRLALYEYAQMNILSNNGVQELAKFSDASYLIFLGDLSAGWREHFEKHFHMKLGEQLPWARSKNQHLLYKPDTFENMKTEFERWEATRYTL